MFLGRALPLSSNSGSYLARGVSSKAEHGQLRKHPLIVEEENHEGK